MDISSITIRIDDGPILGTINSNEEIIKVFSSYKNIAPDNIFEFGDSVYVTESISMNLIDNSYFEIDVFVEFISLITDVPR